MCIVYLILATVAVLLYSCNHIYYNMKYNDMSRGSNFAQITGGVIAAITNGIAWWYVIDSIIKHW